MTRSSGHSVLEGLLGEPSAGHLQARVGFQPVTAGLSVRGSSSELETQEHREAPAGARDRVAVHQRSPDHLPEKQELYQLAISAGRCPGLSVRTS